MLKRTVSFQCQREIWTLTPRERGPLFVFIFVYIKARK